MLNYIIRCPVCGDTVVVPFDANEIICSHCSRKLIKIPKYCICTHTSESHKRNSEECSKCICNKFENARKQSIEDYDKWIEKCFCPHLFKKMKPEGDRTLWYKCLGCGCIYDGLKPSFWQVIDDEN